MRQGLAFVVPFPFLPARAGGQMAAAGFARHLGERADLVVVSTPGNEPEPDAPFTLLPGLRRSPLRYLDLSRLPRIGRALRERGVQRIIVQQPFAAPLFWLLAKVYGMQLEVWSHNLEFRRFRTIGRWFWPLVWLVEGLGYRLATHVYFISPDEIAPARRSFGLAPERCAPLPYGTDRQAPPTDYTALRTATRAEWKLDDDTIALCFFGALGYGPNAGAVDFILRKVLPELKQDKNLKFMILIGGKGLDTKRPELADEHVRYLGFIPDLTAFCAGADLLLNTVATGAGVKTKVLDALAAGLTVVSSAEGALGIDAAVCGDKLRVAADHHPAAYRAEIRRWQAGTDPRTPDSFYRYYYWGHIVQRVLRA